MMKKMISAVLILAVSLTAFTGCTSKASRNLNTAKAENTTQMANPLHECEQEEMTQETGVSLEAPEEAEDVNYAYIDGDQKIAQVTFTLQGTPYCYRAYSTSEIIDMGNSNENAGFEDLKKTLDSAIEIGAELSGYYEKWVTEAAVEVEYCPAVAATSKKGPGFVAWFDVVPGIFYSLGTEKVESTETLLEVAELCFVSAQG